LKKEIIAKVWIVEELFYYSYPFQFPNVLTGELKKHEFSVLSHILTNFSQLSLEKRFDIHQFLESYSHLSNADSKKIKEYFIKYIQLLAEYNLIEKRVLILSDSLVVKVRDKIIRLEYDSICSERLKVVDLILY